MERFDVQFLGSVEVPCHQGNGILCAAMQKVSSEVRVGTGWLNSLMLKASNILQEGCGGSSGCVPWP